MSKSSRLMCFLLALIWGPSAFSATKITSVNRLKHTLEVVIENDMARFNGGQKYHYQLINLKTQKTYTVNIQQGTAIDTSIPGTVPISKKVKIPKIKLKKIGKGPKIASYPTLHYQLLANDKVCENLFVSPKAAKLSDVQTMVKVMGEMANASKGAMLSAGGTPCRIANALIFERFADIGVLMKSVNTEGKISMQIKRIEVDVLVDENYFKIPKGVEVMNMQEMMDRLRASIKK